MNYNAYPVLSKIARREIPAELVLKNCRIVNVFSGEILRGEIAVTDGIIVGMGEGYTGNVEIDIEGNYVAPGFIDSHLHLESTMVTPPEVINEANKFGTTTFIVDPHEAANVAGIDGIDYILDQTANLRANVYVMVPSCVPSGPGEENGGTLAADDLKPYRDNPRILGLGEVMDSNAVITGDPDMMKKLRTFSDKNIDGHAPFLNNYVLAAYAMAGIKTDHECSTYEYAMEEVRHGIHVLIREGSAAHNVEAIVKGIVANHNSTRTFSFCTDDKHIEDIRRQGHISYNIKKSIELGIRPIKAIQMATINAARCYGFDHLGAISPGYQADMVIIGDLHEMDIKAVYHKGIDINKAPRIPVKRCPIHLKNTVNVGDYNMKSLELKVNSGLQDVIELVPGEILTKHLREQIPSEDGIFIPDSIYNKCVSVERHHHTGHIGVGIIKGFNVHNGAIGSSVAHDSHNLNIVGDNDRDIALAIEALREMQGGYVIIRDGKIADKLCLPIMGLMSDAGFEEVDGTLKRMKKNTMEMGVTEDNDPFVTLSFIALTAIPEIRITTHGVEII